MNSQIETNTFYTPAFISDELVIKKSSSFNRGTFSGVGLYRPLVSNEFNPLNKTIYNYSTAYTIPVHGIAFENKSSEIVENPLSSSYKIVDNLHVLNSNVQIQSTPNVEKKTTKKIENVCQMSEILKNTDASQIIEFHTIPQNLALVRSSKLRSFLFREIDVIGSLKNIFSKQKIVKQ